MPQICNSVGKYDFIWEISPLQKSVKKFQGVIATGETIFWPNSTCQGHTGTGILYILAQKPLLGKGGRSWCCRTSTACQFQPPTQIPLTSPMIGFLLKWLTIHNDRHCRWAALSWFFPFGGHQQKGAATFSTTIPDFGRGHPYLWLHIDTGLHWGGMHGFLYMSLNVICTFILWWVCSARENLSMCFPELDLRCPDNTVNLTELLISIHKTTNECINEEILYNYRKIAWLFLTLKWQMIYRKHT